MTIGTPTLFPGPGLPTGWSQVANGGGTATVTPPRAVLAAPAVSLDTITASSATQNAVCIAHALAGGDLDVAAKFDTDVGSRRGDGYGLLVGDGTGGWARFWVFHPNTADERPSFFIASRPAGGGAGTNHYNQTVHQSPHRLQSGCPAWLRFRYTAGTGLWEPFYSTGGGGAAAPWIAHTSFTRSMTVAQFLVGHTSTAPSTAGEVEVGEVWDVAAHGSTDLRGTPPARERIVVGTLTGDDVTLPAGWVDDSSGGDTLTRVTSPRPAWRLASNAANVGSKARILWTGARHEQCGVLLVFRAATGDGDLFSTVALGAGTAEGPQDQYIAGHGYGYELQSGTARRPVEVDDDTAGDVNSVAGSTGLREEPYGWLRDLTGVNLNTGTPRVAVRIERFGPDGGRWFRVREWAPADADDPTADEPATWDVFDGRTDMVRDVALGPSFALTHNNPVGGLAGTASFDLEQITAYEMTEHAPVSGLQRLSVAVQLAPE